jgi:serine/threonine protein kinase
MPEDDSTMNWDDVPEGQSQDPLGIIGWQVGGKYEIDSYLGGGGFGEVYGGFNRHLPEQKLVFKFFKRVQSRSKFVKEAKILCMLDHPNISKVIDFLPEEGALVVAHISGMDGGHVLKENGPLDENLFLKVARAISSSIAYAHEKKIAHRDLKPSNIMFDQNNHVYLIDFGIAKEMGGDATKTAYQALTPLFAAPERQSGESSYNPFLSDIYELGVTLFNLATNNLPYRNPANPNLAEWGGMASQKFSPQLREILMKATHPDPNKRYQTAREMAQALELLQHAYGGAKKRSNIYIYVGIVIVLVVAGFFGRHKIAGLWGSEPATTEQSSQTRVAVSDTTTTAANNMVADTARKNMNASLTPPETTTVASTSHETATEPISTEKKKKEEKPTPTETKTETAKKPPVENKTVEHASVQDNTSQQVTEPSPTMTKLIMNITPSGKSMVTIDGVKGSPDSAFTVKSGRHSIEVIHQDYPIYKKSYSITGASETIDANLKNIFKTDDSVSLQVSLIPSPKDIMIQLKMNGRGYTLSRFPAWDIKKMKGAWQIDAGIFDVSGSADKPKIDSIVVNPYDTGPTRGALKGARGELTLGSKDGNKMESIPMLIYWSK